MGGSTYLPSVKSPSGTNREDLLDAALKRAGRFDRRVQINRPDVAERCEIFKVCWSVQTPAMCVGCRIRNQPLRRSAHLLSSVPLIFRVFQTQIHLRPLRLSRRVDADSLAARMAALTPGMVIVKNLCQGATTPKFCGASYLSGIVV